MMSLKLFHGHSYSGNPLSCAAAIANLEIFESENTLEKLQKNILFFENELKRVQRFKSVSSIRNKGLMAGIDLVKNPENNQKYEIKEELAKKVCDAALKEGVLLETSWRYDCFNAPNIN